MLSQFTKEHESHRTLGDLYDFPKDVYPIGRLDKDSEGLLILSNDKKIVDQMLNPTSKVEKTYWVQVEGLLQPEILARLMQGLEIKIKTGKYHLTAPCVAALLHNPTVQDRNPPIRFRKNSPTSWASITISEGKNRQVRKMFAKVGFPVLRLIRKKIGELTLEGMKIGDVIEIPALDINS